MKTAYDKIHTHETSHTQDTTHKYQQIIPQEKTNSNVIKMVSSENKQKNKEKVKIGWGGLEKVEKEGLKLHM